MNTKCHHDGCGRWATPGTHECGTPECPGAVSYGAVSVRRTPYELVASCSRCKGRRVASGSFVAPVIEWAQAHRCTR